MTAARPDRRGLPNRSAARAPRTGTSLRPDTALVLGGGGPVGIGWHAGLLHGWADAGLDLASTDLVLGTSAGAVVAAYLTTGRAPVDALDAVTSRSSRRPRPSRQRADPAPAAEDRVVGSPLFAALADTPWPAALRVTATSHRNGRRVCWVAADRLPLARCVAASAAVPGVFPAPTIAGERFVDGGTSSLTNADLVVGTRHAVVVSCIPHNLRPAATGVARIVADAADRLRAEIDGLRRTGTEVVVVEPPPTFLAIAARPEHLMDPHRAQDAFDAGRSHARDQVGRPPAIGAGSRPHPETESGGL